MILPHTQPQSVSLLQEQRCAPVAPSLIRLAQVNDLQPLKTAASSPLVTPVLHWCLFSSTLCHFTLPGLSGRSYMSPSEEVQNKFTGCSAQGLWFICPHVFIKWKIASLFSPRTMPTYFISCQHFKCWYLASTPSFLKCRPWRQKFFETNRCLWTLI